MKIPVRFFQPDPNFSALQIFSKLVEDDPWVMFHGTSSSSAEFIESVGFQFPISAIKLNDLQRAAAIFEGIKWCGNQVGGYPVLKTFSIQYDFSSPLNSPVFFAETSLRALLHATKDFAGGEKLRALRIAFKDLETYLSDPSLRKQHFDKLTRKAESLKRLNASAETIEAAMPLQIDLDTLYDQVSALKDLRKLAEDAKVNFGEGVIFAVRMEPDDVEELSYSASMGIAARKHIPASKIIEKVIVTAEPSEDFLFQEDLILMDRLVKGSSGLVSALCNK